jgi:uncharacterized metal-binding protein YceD (DUF177 family)
MNAAKPITKLPWSLPVTLADIPEEGRHFDLVADERTRAQVAQVAGLQSLPRLQASFDVARRGPDGLHVGGEVSATVGQTCIVTLEPLNDEVKEAIDLVFAPPTAASLEQTEETEIAESEGPEPLIGDGIDLGALATEFLILGIDPYPRKPDAAFESPAAKDDGSSHPFAALAALKQEPEKKE